MHISKYLITSLIILLFSNCTNKDTSQLLEEAKVHLAQNNYNAAIIPLKNALQNSPKNPEIRLTLGLTYIKTGQFVEAEKELRRASELGVSDDIIYPSLSKSLYYQNYLDQTVIMAQNFKSQDPKALSKVALFGWLAQLKTGLNTQNKTLELDKQNLVNDDLLLATSYELFIQGSANQAFEKLQSIQNSEEKLEILLLSGMIHASLKDFENAIKSFKQAITLAPSYYIAYFQISEVLINNNDLNDAEIYVDSILSINEKNAYANILKSQIAFRRDDFELANTTAVTAIQNGMDTPLANLVAGISSYRLDKLESAYRYLSKIKEDIPPNHYANRVLVEIKLRLGETDDIKELVNKFTNNPEEDANILAATAISMFQQGDIHEAITFFEKSNETLPNNAINLLREGLAKISTQDYTGIGILEKAIENDEKMIYAWSLLAQAHLQNNDIEAAFNTVERWEKINSIEGSTLKAYLLLQLDKTDEAKPILEKVISSQPNHKTALRFLMLINAREKNYKEARSQVEHLLSLDNQNFNSYVDLLNISIAQNDSKSAEVFIQNMINNAQDSNKTVEMKVALAMLYNYQQEYQETIDLLSSIKSLSNERALTLLGDTYVYLKQYSEAYQVYNTLLGIYPNSKTAWLKIITLFNTTRDYKLGYNAINEAIKIFKDDFDLQALQAILMLNNNDATNAEKVINNITNQNKEADILIRLNGHLALLNGELQKAEKLIYQYYKKYPNFETAQLLASALGANGKVLEGGKYLEDESTKSYSSFKDIHYIAEYYSKYEQFDQAAIQYKKLLDRDSQHFITLNNYAALLSKLGQLESSFDYANKALKIIPDSPYAMDTAGWALFKQGKVKEALYYLDKAYEKLPTNSEIQLHYAETLLADNQKTKAKRVLNNIKPKNSKEQEELKQLVNSI